VTSLALAGVVHAQADEDDYAVTARLQAAAALKQQAADAKAEAERKVKADAEATAKAKKAKEDAEAAADWAAMTPAERTAAREQHALNQALIEAAKGGTVKVEPAKADPPPGPTVGQRIGAGLKAVGAGFKAAGAKSTMDCNTTGSGDSAHTTCTTN
jgi:hypothetical protein